MDGNARYKAKLVSAATMSTGVVVYSHHWGMFRVQIAGGHLCGLPKPFTGVYSFPRLVTVCIICILH